LGRGTEVDEKLTKSTKAQRKKADVEKKEQKIQIFKKKKKIPSLLDIDD